MTNRIFGPIKGVGTSVEELEGDQQITTAPLGPTGYVGILQKGRVGELMEILSKNDFVARAGGLIPESFVPDVVFDFFKEGNGRGRILLQRITDGTEVKASLTLKNRGVIKKDVVKIEADNGGRWAGRKRKIANQYVSITATTLTTEIVMLEDEFKGSTLSLPNAIPGKSFEVIGNDTAGILTLNNDVDLVLEIGTSTDKLYSAVLENNDSVVSVRTKNGINDAINEWGLEVLVDGIQVRDYENLSSDPDATNYFVNVINDDTSNFYISVTDLNTGTINPEVRPANYFNESSTLTATVLTANIVDTTVASATSGVTASIVNPTYGASLLDDILTLEVTGAGSRATETLTLVPQPSDGEVVTINGRVITFKTVVADPLNEVLIGGDQDASLTNLVTFINTDVDVLIKDVVFAENPVTLTLDLYASNANVAGNSLSTTTDITGASWGGATLTGGTDQVWSVTSGLQSVFATTATTGIAYTGENDFTFGFTILDRTFDSSKNFQVGETITMDVEPFVVNQFAGNILIPNVDERRKTFSIVSNTQTTITVKTGNDMTVDATVGDGFSIDFNKELGGGYDGIVGIIDQNYIDAYDTSTSLFNETEGKNLGLVKFATPGITSTSVQKAGVAYAEAKNHQYREEIPSNITTEQAAEEYVNDTIGRNDYAVTIFPSYAYVQDREKEGLKLVPVTGMVHGREALVANNNGGYHKAAAGIDVTLPSIVKLPTGDKVLNEEFLNPQGINVIKKNKGNFIIWGDRTLSLTTAWKFKHQREYMSHQGHILRENFDWIIFGINSTRSNDTNQLITALTAHFLGEFNLGALEGASLQDAVQIKIDGENNTPLTRSQGDLNAEIIFRIVDTIERLKFKIGKAGIFEQLNA